MAMLNILLIKLEMDSEFLRREEELVPTVVTGNRPSFKHSATGAFFLPAIKFCQLEVDLLGQYSLEIDVIDQAGHRSIHYESNITASLFDFQIVAPAYIGHGTTARAPLDTSEGIDSSHKIKINK